MTALVFVLTLLAQTPEPSCQALNDNRQAEEAARCYENTWKATNSPEALLGAARNQLWAGDSASSARAYEEYLRRDSLNREVTIEYIRLLRYRGGYKRAEELSNRLLEVNPEDKELLALRAEVLYWAGNRGFQERRDAERSGDAVEQIAAMEATGLYHAASQKMHALAAEDAGSDMAKFLNDRLDDRSRIRAELPYSVYNDSDGIRDVLYQTNLVIPVHLDHSLSASVSEYVSSAPLGSVFTAGRTRASVREFSLGGNVRIAPGLHLLLSGGGSILRTEAMPGGGGIRPIYRAELSGSPWDKWQWTLGGAREFLKVTPRAIDQEIHSDSVFVSARYWLEARTSLSARLDRNWWSDGNHGLQAEGVFSHTFLYNRRFNLDAGALTNHQVFARDLLPVSGFFTPDHYSRYNALIDTHREVQRWLTWEIRGEGGAQQITSGAGYLPDWSATVRLTARLSPMLSLYGSYERKNYSLIARDGWYQGFYVSLSAHLVSGL